MRFVDRIKRFRRDWPEHKPAVALFLFVLAIIASLLYGRAR